MEDIAKQAVSRYSQDGVVSLSFGLLLITLLYYTWQLNKQSAVERASFLAAAEKKDSEHMAHVEKFVAATVESTAVVKRATETLDTLTQEVQGMKDGLGRLAERVDHIDRRGV